MSKTGKIVLWAVIALVLTGVLIWGIVGGSAWQNAWSGFANMVSKAGINVNGLVDQLPDDAQTSEFFEKDANGIKRISLQFVDENVNVVVAEDDKISVKQESDKKLNEDEIMHYGVKNGELMVQSGRIGGTIFNWSQSKSITVTLAIPKSFSGILEVTVVSGNIEEEGANASHGKFNSTSGNITVDGATFAKELRAESVSGNVDIQQCESAKLKLNSMSGGLSAEGKFAESDISSTSGEIDLVCAGAAKVATDTTSGETTLEFKDAASLKKISMNSVSGTLTVKLPKNDGFDLEFDTVSGDLSNDFAMKGNRYQEGGIAIEANSVSGELNIVEL